MPNAAYPSRISTIFYLGLEGLGGADLITDEDENVRAFSPTSASLLTAFRGLMDQSNFLALPPTSKILPSVSLIVCSSEVNVFLWVHVLFRR